MNPALSPITFQQIQIFLLVVEEGGFAKAGNKLHLTQSTVSKNIAKLEATIGFPLFYRTTREIRLTAEGRSLAESWSPLLQELEEGFVRATSLHGREASLLRLGLTNTVVPEHYMHDAMETFEEKYPDCSIVFGTGHIWELKQRLLEGTIDAMMLPDFESYWVKEKGLSFQWAARSNAYVLLSKDHPLADRDSFKLKDLLDERFIVFRIGDDNYCTIDLEARFAPYKKKPHIVSHYESAHDMRYRFRKNKTDMIFIDSFFEFPQTAGMKRVPIIDQHNGLICVWHPKNVKPLLQKFLKHCLKVPPLKKSK